MRYLTKILLAGCAASQAIALPHKSRAEELQSSLNKLGVDTSKIPQLGANSTDNQCQSAVSFPEPSEGARFQY